MTTKIYNYLAKDLYNGIRVKIDTEFCLILNVKRDKETWQETTMVVEYQFAGSERETILFMEWERVEVQAGIRGVDIIKAID